MRVILVNIRDPQFYALPAKTRAKNGNVRVMGFPPIGIMSLSAVLKQAGHECCHVRSGQPRDAERGHHRGDSTGSSRHLVGLSFLSAPPVIPTRRFLRVRSAPPTQGETGVRRRFCQLERRIGEAAVPEVDFVCRGDGEQLILDLLERSRRSFDGGRPDVARKDGKLVQNPNRPMERNLDQWPFPDRESLPLDFVESMPLDVPAVLSMERFTTMQTSRGCPWPCVFCDIPIFNEGKWRSRSPQHVVAEFKHLAGTGLWVRLFCRRPFPAATQADRGDLPRDQRSGVTIQWGMRRARGFRGPTSVSGHGEGPLPHAHVRDRERQSERFSIA